VAWGSSPERGSHLRHALPFSRPWSTRAEREQLARAWVTCTNIDCPTTYVGGSVELIERLLVDDVLEAVPAQLTDPWDGHG
jgi:hypothetical protein